MALTTTPKSKRSTHHKKVSGDHHRRAKNYLRTYHPYLPLLLLVIIGLAINTFWTPTAAVLGESTALTSQTLMENTNIERSKQQARDLSINPSLKAAAQTKAEDMAAKDYWSHTTPDGLKPWAFIDASGYKYQAAAENLAYGFSHAPAIVYGWMNSDEHRRNMLNPLYQEVGFGIARAPDFQGQGPTIIIVALYGQPSQQSGFTGLLGAATSGPSDIAPSMNTISRIELLAGGRASETFIVTLALTFAGLLLFVYRHARIWHRVLVRSEDFVIHHKALDFVIVTYTVTGFVLTRAAGYTH